MLFGHRQEPFAGGAMPGMQPAMPPRDWHMAMKEYVRQQLYSEMEPMRVQVAVLEKKMVDIDDKTQQVVLAEKNASRDRTPLSEKKLEDDIAPRLENMISETDQKIAETVSRLTRAEGVLREIGALHDKFARRHDSLVECLEELDTKVEKITSTVHMKENFHPHNSHGKMPQLHCAPSGGGDISNGWVPPPPPLKGGQHQNDFKQDAKNWIATDHKASLEVEEFNFDVEKKPGTPLGMVLRNDGSKLVVDKANNNCSIPVEQGDRIVAIDGVRGDSDTLLRLLQRIGHLKITCQRLLSTSL